MAVWQICISRSLNLYFTNSNICLHFIWLREWAPSSSVMWCELQNGNVEWQKFTRNQEWADILSISVVRSRENTKREQTTTKKQQQTFTNREIAPHRGTGEKTTITTTKNKTGDKMHTICSICLVLCVFCCFHFQFWLLNIEHNVSRDLYSCSIAHCALDIRAICFYSILGAYVVECSPLHYTTRWIVTFFPSKIVFLVCLTFYLSKLCLTTVYPYSAQWSSFCMAHTHKVFYRCAGVTLWASFSHSQRIWPYH